jgi:pyridoxamine 5'-phosphate oxidase
MDPSTKPDFSSLRNEYRQRSLSERDANQDPFHQFGLWLNEAIAAGAHEPNAMTLATCTREGVPSARMVLLKDVGANGFTFYTNYLSRKGRELEDNPRAALVFYWPELERQVRVEGTVERTSEAESNKYWSTRPADSRLGSAASAQSEPAASREALEQQFELLRSQYKDGNIPRPKHWGGYRLRPLRIEFWQGRPNRLHDRIEYLLDGETHWVIQRLSP